MVDERRTISLESARADGWFQRLGEGAPHFAQLCEAVGEKVVAFAVVAGARIVSVSVDRRAPDASAIEFTLGDDQKVHTLALGELRRRLALTLAEVSEEPAELADDPTDEQLQHFIGFRTLLLAPLFGVGLRSLEVGGGRPPTIWVELGDEEEEISLDDLRASIRERVQSEARQRAGGGSPFAIDMEIVPEAKTAADVQDWERVVELLGAWPGPLSMLLRTAEGQGLPADVKTTLVGALGLLGTACVESGRDEWGDEVMRLGIQWGQEVGGPALAGLFARLGAAHFSRGRPGQAIGILRRALSLGADEREVLPTLARCYNERQRHLAAVVCAEQALALGVESDALDDVVAESVAALGAPWTRFRERFPAPSCTAETTPPPAPVEDA